ncbi:hypothetical protein BJY00DRAFT_281450 [Aspergillus carlsbadensis]|nr:hypothetical protein BJY00DRAFT_281450 [Aspergillus carlsbadensis]
MLLLYLVPLSFSLHVLFLLLLLCISLPLVLLRPVTNTWLIPAINFSCMATRCNLGSSYETAKTPE